MEWPIASCVTAVLLVPVTGKVFTSCVLHDEEKSKLAKASVRYVFFIIILQRTEVGLVTTRKASSDAEKPSSDRKKAVSARILYASMDQCRRPWRHWRNRRQEKRLICPDPSCSDQPRQPDLRIPPDSFLRLR